MIERVHGVAGCSRWDLRLPLVCAALLIAGGVVPVASAQSPATPATIATDRPAVTDSSAVVPNRGFQAENGLLDTGNPGSRTLDFPATLIRVGVGPSTELRFTAPDYFQGSPASGFGDLVLGVKQQIVSVSGLRQEGCLSMCRPKTDSTALSVSPHFFWIDSRLKPGMPLPNTRAVFRKPAGRATSCTSERLIRSHRGSNSICMRESGFPRLQHTTSSGSATRFAFRSADDRLAPAVSYLSRRRT